MNLSLKMKPNVRKFFSRSDVDRYIQRLGTTTFTSNGISCCKCNGNVINLYSIQKRRATRTRDEKGRYKTIYDSSWMVTVYSINKDLLQAILVTNNQKLIQRNNHFDIVDN